MSNKSNKTQLKTASEKNKAKNSIILTGNELWTELRPLPCPLPASTRPSSVSLSPFPLVTRIFQRAFCHFEICHLTCGNNKMWLTHCCSRGKWGVAGGKGFPIRIAIQCEVGTGQAGVGYMALGGIMLAFGINVSQFRENLLCPPAPPPPAFVAAASRRGRLGDLHECDLKIKQRFFFIFLLLLRIKRINHSLEQRERERERA